MITFTPMIKDVQDESAWLDGRRIARFTTDGPRHHLHMNGNTFEFNSHDSAVEYVMNLYDKRNKSMLSDISKDVKGFITDNRQIIYWMALIFLLDHFFFAGAFRERLKGLAEKMLGKVEKQIEAK